MLPDRTNVRAYVRFKFTFSVNYGKIPLVNLGSIFVASIVYFILTVTTPGHSLFRPNGIMIRFCSKNDIAIRITFN